MNIPPDVHDLQRFVQAQEHSFSQALAEVRNGQKRSHWMWYIFPQYRGLGHSFMAKRYAIGSIDEANAYLRHPVLGPRLVECAEAALGVRGRTAHEIFGSPDDVKLHSSATLFASVEDASPVFQQLLDKYFDGRPDKNTLLLLADTE